MALTRTASMGSLGGLSLGATPSSPGGYRGQSSPTRNKRGCLYLPTNNDPNEAHISLAAQRWNVQKYFHAPIPLSSCTVDPKKEAVVLVSGTHGSVFTVDDSFSNEPRLQIRTETTGMPSAVAFESNGSMFIGDMQAKCVRYQAVNPFSDKTAAVSVLVKDFEGRPLQGPSGMAFDVHSGTLYFADGGPAGATGVHNPKGSLFCVKDEMLHPIAYECLAAPSGVALSPDGRIIYVAETMQNRVLRFVLGPEGSYHSTVFYQASGSVGPVALCTDRDGKLYIGMLELINHVSKKAASKQLGKVIVADENGVVQEVIAVPLPNISGITALHTEGRPTLYVTADTVLYKLQAES